MQAYTVVPIEKWEDEKLELDPSVSNGPSDEKIHRIYRTAKEAYNFADYNTVILEAEEGSFCNAIVPTCQTHEYLWSNGPLSKAKCAVVMRKEAP